MCGHSNVLSCRTVYYAVQGGSVDEGLVCDHSNESYFKKQYFHGVPLFMLVLFR